MKIKLLSEHESLEALEDKSFLDVWKALSQQQAEMTLNQEYGFVASWYKAYSDKCRPLLVIGLDNAEKTIGIIPLAIVYKTGEIFHAGEGKSEYHGWICTKEVEEEFLIQALLSIKNKYKPTKWNWGWIPPTANTQWLKSEVLKNNGIFINSIESESPINILSDTTRLTKIKKHRSLRTQVNKLNAVGELRLERITDKETTAKILDTIINQCNFRNLALHNYLPFDFDPYRKDWLMNHIAEPENIHLTVLWQGDNILASNYGYCDQKTVILGLFTHDPSQSSNSPGSIFLIKLMEFIKEEGFQNLDITPGGDAYKERFCNSHNKIIKPTICFNQYENIKHQAITSIKKYFKKRFTARDFATLKMLIEKDLYAVSKQKILDLVQGNYQTYVLDKHANQKPTTQSPFLIRIHQFDDLLLYQSKDNYLTRKELASQALKNFQRGDTLYTIVDENILVSYAWLAYSGKKHWHPHLKDQINNTDKSSYIYDIYIHKEYSPADVFTTYMQRINNDVVSNKTVNTYLIKPLRTSESILIYNGFCKLPKV